MTARRSGKVKRIVWVALGVVALGCGASACKKAHDAGNDSMKAGNGGIVATSGQVAGVRYVSDAGTPASDANGASSTIPAQ